jgi:alanyl-tRNA synthetase
MEGFERAMEGQRKKARQSWKGSGEEAVSDVFRQLTLDGITTDFCGYEGVTTGLSEIAAILVAGHRVDRITEGAEAEIIVYRTPFYGEVGGQIGDTGLISGNGFEFVVTDAKRPLDNLIVHQGKLVKGTLNTGDAADLLVNEGKRRDTEANHSATHLLQAALKEILGEHVKQSGSLVNNERLRFDFTHFSRISEEELRLVEGRVNAMIRANVPVETHVLPLQEAVKTGATAVFDEKYGDTVRVLRMGEFSRELCGGTHVFRTGDIGFFKIVHESSVAAGVRRIEALTGRGALSYSAQLEDELRRSSALLKCGLLEAAEKTEKLLRNQRELEKEIDALKGKMAARDSGDLMEKLHLVNGINVISAVVGASDARALRDFGDKLRDRIQSGVILLGCRVEDKAMLLCLVTKDLTERCHAGRIIGQIAPIVGGKGGGRPDMAQAGGPSPEFLEKAMERLDSLLQQ